MQKTESYYVKQAMAEWALCEHLGIPFEQNGETVDIRCGGRTFGILPAEATGDVLAVVTPSDFDRDVMVVAHASPDTSTVHLLGWITKDLARVLFTAAIHNGYGGMPLVLTEWTLKPMDTLEGASMS
jgi:hypothetical protein